MIIPTLFPFPLYYHFRCLRPPDTCPTLGGPSPACSLPLPPPLPLPSLSTLPPPPMFLPLQLVVDCCVLLGDLPSLLVDCCRCVTAAVFVVLTAAAAAVACCRRHRVVVSSGIHMQGHKENHLSWVVLFHLRLPSRPPS
jgi:hypothetical protein